MNKRSVLFALLRLLKHNFFRLLPSVTENSAGQNQVANPNRANRVWFDNIVVSAGYVGSLR
jgi:hypothetical protein